jgi:hypothetical protein
MGKGVINREKCNIPEELSIQAQAILVAITMKSVNGIVRNYFIYLCAVLALQ